MSQMSQDFSEEKTDYDWEHEGRDQESWWHQVDFHVSISWLFIISLSCVSTLPKQQSFLSQHICSVCLLLSCGSLGDRVCQQCCLGQLAKATERSVTSDMGTAAGSSGDTCNHPAWSLGSQWG